MYLPSLGYCDPDQVKRESGMLNHLYLQQSQSNLLGLGGLLSLQNAFPAQPSTPEPNPVLLLLE